MKKDNKIEKARRGKKAWLWKTPVVMLLSFAVIMGIFSIFAQFDTDSVPGYFIAHKADMGFTYYEWDDEGIRHELEAVYNQYGYWDTVNGSAFMDKSRNPFGEGLEDGEPTDEIPDDEGPFGQLPVGGGPLNIKLIAMEAMEEASVDHEANAPETIETTPARHRFGFSVKLEEQIEWALLMLNGTTDVPYVVFLDDDLLYTDFPGESASLGSPPTGMGGYDPSTSMNIVVSLPADYVGRTLTVIEYIKPEQAAYWNPAVPRVATDETDAVLAVIAYGPKGIMGGMIAAVLVILTVLFIRKLFGGGKPFLLLLPIIYTLIYMIAKSGYISFYSTHFFNEIQNLIWAFSFYCAGDLLLIFFAFKMKRPVRFGLAAAATVHFLISSGILLHKFFSDKNPSVDQKWIGIFGFAVLLFTVILMFSERKTNRYLKYSGWMFLAVCAGYGFLNLIFYFLDQGTFVELSSPIAAAVESLHFFNLNQFISVFIMIVITVSSIIEYIAELTESRIRLVTLEQINRLKIEFLGNVSHELKTPLTVMSSYAQITEKSMAKQQGAEELTHNMKLIKSEAERLSLMVSQILDITRIEENHLNVMVSPCDLTQLIQVTLDTYYPVFSKNRNKLVFNQPVENISVLCDPDRIMQVLVNLIGNAAKHTQNGVITVHISKEAVFAAVKVTDTGKGMDVIQAARAFDRYYTSSYNEKTGAGQNTGTGLGLYICQHIIKEHGGEIAIQSEVGKGTEIRFTLPLSKKA